MSNSCPWKQGCAVLGADRETSHQIKQGEHVIWKRQCFQPCFKPSARESGTAIKADVRQREIRFILLLLPPAQGYSKSKAAFHFPLDKQVVQQSWETRKKRGWRFYNCGADIAGDKGAASSGATIFIARMVYIKEETQHGFQIDKAELKNLAARVEIADF